MDGSAASKCATMDRTFLSSKFSRLHDIKVMHSSGSISCVASCTLYIVYVACMVYSVHHATRECTGSMPIAMQLGPHCQTVGERKRSHEPVSPSSARQEWMQHPFFACSQKEKEGYTQCHLHRGAGSARRTGNIRRGCRPRTWLGDDIAHSCPGICSCSRSSESFAESRSSASLSTCRDSPPSPIGPADHA
jgi:hypothetical protein